MDTLPTLAKPPVFDALHASVRAVAKDVAAAHADDVDRKARFPQETIDALRGLRLMSAQLPVELGGFGLTMRQLGTLVGTLAEQCSSSAMVWAMHLNQVACLVRHGRGDPAILDFLGDLAERQCLIASMTSEVGTSGEMRKSICAVEKIGDRVLLEKAATTGSYCEQADAILVTAKRHPEAAPNDQVLVLVRREERSLKQTTTWDTLGMRGTCSPGFDLRASVPAGQVMSVPFADIAAASIVPYSHILWSALWCGIAAGACERAATWVRQLARQSPGSLPPNATRLAGLSGQLQALRRHWQSMADEFDREVAAGTDAETFSTRQWALQLNNLKVSASELAPQLVHGALQVIGIAAYKNDGPLSLGRAYRDSLSGALMVSNDRINAASASLLLVHRGV